MNFNIEKNYLSRKSVAQFLDLIHSNQAEFLNDYTFVQRKIAEYIQSLREADSQ